MATTKPRFSTAYDILVVNDGIDFSDDPGYTKQEFKDECDVNVIMKKYTNFGVVPEVREPGQFGDFTNVPDLMEAHAIVQQSQDDFAALPSAVRERFANDPIRLMKFVEDVGNRDEAIRLGLIVVEAPVEPVVPTPPPKAAGAPGNSATP